MLLHIHGLPGYSRITSQAQLAARWVPETLWQRPFINSAAANWGGGCWRA